MSVIAQLAATPGGALLIFTTTFAILFIPGMWLVFREHNHEMDKINKQIRNLGREDTWTNYDN